jgi:hypothetical protein
MVPAAEAPIPVVPEDLFGISVGTVPLAADVEILAPDALAASTAVVVTLNRLAPPIEIPTEDPLPHRPDPDGNLSPGTDASPSIRTTDP